MLAKIAALILVSAAAAAGLLSVRQQRLEAVHEMSAAVRRAEALDRQLWRVRIDLARRITPERVHELAQQLGPLEPVPLEWCPPADGDDAPPAWLGELGELDDLDGAAPATPDAALASAGAGD